MKYLRDCGVESYCLIMSMISRQVRDIDYAYYVAHLSSTSLMVSLFLWRGPDTYTQLML